MTRQFGSTIAEWKLINIVTVAKEGLLNMAEVRFEICFTFCGKTISFVHTLLKLAVY
jgi:hypothetical protein